VSLEVDREGEQEGSWFERLVKRFNTHTLYSSLFFPLQTQFIFADRVARGKGEPCHILSDHFSKQHALTTDRMGEAGNHTKIKMRRQRFGVRSLGWR